MKRKLVITLFLTSLVLQAAGGSALAVLYEYDEGFNSKQFCDTLHTSAWWDTVSGVIKLRTMEMFSAGYLAAEGFSVGIDAAGDYVYIADELEGLQIVDISDIGNPVPAGSVGFAANIKDVKVQGDFAYVSADTLGLIIVDVSDPVSPDSVGSYSIGERVYSLDVVGNRAFLAGGSEGLIVIDVSDPVSPSYLAACDTPGEARGVVLAGDKAFVADYTSGLQVVDVSDPLLPSVAGSYDTGGNSLRVAVTGNYAYLADFFPGVQVIDISDPAAPSYVTTYDTPSWSYDVAVDGNLLYVADYTSGLQLVDISDPSNPLPAGSFDQEGAYQSVVTNGGGLAFVTSYNGFHIVKAADILNTLEEADLINTSGLIHSVAIDGNYAYLAAESGGLQVIDVSDPYALAAASAGGGADNAYELALNGDHAYVADDFSGGISVFDISDPANPFRTGYVAVSGEVRGVDTWGEYAFAGCGNQGLASLNISDPAAPAVVQNLAGFTGAGRLRVYGKRAFVSDGSGGLKIVDISDPSSMSLEGSYSASGGVADVVVEGRHAFLAAGTGGLEIVDVSDPANPSNISSLAPPFGEARGLDISGGFALVALSGGGVWLIDVADIYAPVSEWVYNTVEGCRGVAFSGEYGFAAIGTEGVGAGRIFQRDFVTSENMARSTFIDNAGVTIYRVKLSTVQTGSVTWEVSADGGGNWQEIIADDSWTDLAVTGSDLLWRAGLIYLGDGVNPSCDSLMIDWSDDVATLLASQSVRARENSIILRWALAEDPSGRLCSVRRRKEGDDPFSEIALVSSPGREFSFEDKEIEFGAVYDYRVLLSEGSGWTVLFERGGVKTPHIPVTLYQNTPNPFNPSTRIRYFIPEPLHVRLSVFDASGKLVRILADGNKPSGFHAETWNGTDERGGSVASGVYFYNLRAGKKETTRKMILMR